LIGTSKLFELLPPPRAQGNTAPRNTRPDPTYAVSALRSLSGARVRARAIEGAGAGAGGAAREGEAVAAMSWRPSTHADHRLVHTILAQSPHRSTSCTSRPAATLGPGAAAASGCGYVAIPPGGVRCVAWNGPLPMRTGALQRSGDLHGL